MIISLCFIYNIIFYISYYLFFGLSFRWPKMNRDVPLMASTPTVAMNNPMQAPIRPLKILLLETPAMTDRPNTARAKYSAGPNSSVIFAISGARNSNAKALTRPPI